MWRNLYIALCLLITSNFLFAQQISVDNSPSWLFGLRPDLKKTPASRDINNGYYMELIDKQTNVPAKTEYTHFIRHIVNETGVQNASEISVEFIPDYQHVIFHKISLIREGKIVSTLKVTDIKVVQEETESANFQYNGIKRAFVVLKDVRSNDRIDVAYSLVGFNPVFKGKFSDEFYFYSDVAVTNYFQTIITTKDHPLNFRYFNESPAPRKFHHEDTLMYFWQDPPLKVPETNNSTPSWYNRYNSVSVTEYKNWKEVSDWGLTLFQKYQVPLNPDLKNQVARFLKESNGDKTLFTELATRFVQDQIRYLGLETGIYTHQPHDPGQVCSQRFGDCKDKAFLLAIMLREAKINAYVALTSTNLTSSLIKQDASPHKFNHAIVAIDNGNGYQFIDATISYQRGSLKDLYIPNYGYALVLRSETIDMVAIPPGKSKKTEVKEKLFVRYKEAGPSILEVETNYDGAAADYNREIFAGTSIADLQKNFLRYYGKYYDSIELEKEIVIQDDPVKNRLHLSETYRLPALWKIKDNGKESLEAISHVLLEYFPNPGSSYKQGPLSLSFPQNVHYTLELHLPDTWAFPMDDYHISNDSYQFDFSVVHKDSVIILDYQLSTFKDHISEDRVTAYMEDYKHILDRFDYILTRNGQTDITTPSSSTQPVVHGINATGLIVWMVLLVSLFFTFRYCNRLSVETHYLPKRGQAIGGWLVVLGIVLALSIILQGKELFSYNFFSLADWYGKERLGGTNLQLLIVIEEVFNIILTSAYAALFYWFLKKRDIFPRAFITVIILKMCLIVLLTFFYTVIPYPQNSGDFTKEMIMQFIRSAISGAIWITYVIRSERVKNTFIKPYFQQLHDSNIHQETNLVEVDKDPEENQPDIPEI